MLAHAEAWGSSGGFFLMVLNARMGIEGFYTRYGYQALGEPFQENTVPHIRMTKRLRP
jgi:predicted GNAT family N-acyltransferase